MAEKKNYWYILVLTNNGPVFVTKCSTRDAEWEKLEKPISFTANVAKDTAWALRLNGYVAYAICNTYEIDNQPYLYNKGEFKWIWNEEALATGRYKNQED